MGYRKLMGGKDGYTLVELLVVVSIIGILMTIVVPKFSDSTVLATTAKTASDLRTIDSAVATDCLVNFDTRHSYQAIRGIDPGIADLVSAGYLASPPVAPKSGQSLYIGGSKCTLTADASYSLTGSGSGLRTAISGTGLTPPAGVTNITAEYIHK